MSTLSIFDKINEHRIKNNLEVYEKHPINKCIDDFMKETTVEKLIEEFAINPNVTRSFTIPNNNYENFSEIIISNMKSYFYNIHNVFEHKISAETTISYDFYDKFSKYYDNANKKSATITINYKLLIG
jgi:hypothetical protein